MCRGILLPCDMCLLLSIHHYAMLVMRRMGHPDCLTVVLELLFWAYTFGCYNLAALLHC
jgi:hypothetical protein